MTGVNRDILKFLKSLSTRDNFSGRVKEVVNVLRKAYAEGIYEVILLHSRAQMPEDDWVLVIDAIHDTSDTIKLQKGSRQTHDRVRIVHMLRQKNTKIRKLHVVINYPGRVSDEYFLRAMGYDDEDIPVVPKTRKKSKDEEVVENFLNHILYEHEKTLLADRIIDASINNPDEVQELHTMYMNLKPPKEKLYKLVRS